MNAKLLSVAVASLVASSAFAQSTTETQAKTTTNESYSQPASTDSSMTTKKTSTKRARAHKKSATHHSTSMNKARGTNTADAAYNGAYDGARAAARNNANDVSNTPAYNGGRTTSNDSVNTGMSSAETNQAYNGTAAAAGTTATGAATTDYNANNANAVNNGTGTTYQSTTTTEHYNTTTSAAPMGTGTSYGVNTYAPEQTLRTETFSLAPQFGVVTFTDATGETDSRSTAGLGLNFNLIPSSPEYPKNTYFGISTGAFYSHLGGPGSNFWGSDDNSGYNQGANLVLIPANLKLGHNFSDSFRASIHGGGNVIYRSAPEAAVLGSGSDVNTNSWAILPNAGLDLEWQVGNNVAIIARPDVTIAPGNNMFVGTLGATIMPSF